MEVAPLTHALEIFDAPIHLELGSWLAPKKFHYLALATVAIPEGIEY